MTGQRTLAVLMKGYPRLSETFIAQEIRSLERAGFKLRIFAMRHPTDKTVHPVHREIKAPVSYLPEYLHHAPLRVLKSLWRARHLPGFKTALRTFFEDLRHDFTRSRVRRLGQAAVLAVEMPADVAQIYVHFIHTPGSVARYAATMTGMAWACSAHAKDIWTTPARELAGKIASADFVVTCTDAGLQYLNTLAPADKPVHLVYHGLDLSRFRPLLAPSTERNGSLDGKPVRFLTVARAVEKKGLDTLIEALALLPHDLSWTWTHIGGGDLIKSLKGLAHSRGIADRCQFLGARPQEDVLAAYREADVFVLPCRVAADGDRDGLPNVLMEAGSQGLAIVSTPVSGVTELVENGITGVIVPPDDQSALADTLAQLAAHPTERYRLGRAASRKVFGVFDHDKAIQGLVDLLPASLRTAEEAPHMAAE